MSSASEIEDHTTIQIIENDKVNWNKMDKEILIIYLYSCTSMRYAIHFHAMDKNRLIYRYHDRIPSQIITNFYNGYSTIR